MTNLNLKSERLGSKSDCDVEPIPDVLQHPSYLHANYQGVSRKHNYGAKCLKTYIGIDLWAFERWIKHKRTIRRQRMMIRVLKILISLVCAISAWCIYNDLI